MAKRRYEQKNEEKNNAIRMRASAFKEKEKVTMLLLLLCSPLNRKCACAPQATMDMFQQLAKQRFG